MAGFGDRVRDAMLAAGMDTPTRLARACNVSRQTVLSWLNMDAPELRATHLLALADALRVRMRWLSTGSGPVPISPELDELTDIAAQLPPGALAEWKAIGKRMTE